MTPDDAVALARLIQLETSAPITETEVHGLVASWEETKAVPVRPGVPVVIGYDLVEVREDSLLVHPDIYGKGGASVKSAMTALARAGADTSGVDRSVLTALVRAGRKAHSGRELSELMRNE
jgi:hypothetical protein